MIHTIFRSVRVLGLSAFYHDSAAVLVDGGRIVAAAQEERFTRRKHDAGYPHHAIACCLAESGMALADVDRVAFYDKPFLKFERLLETAVAFAPRGLRAFAAAVAALQAGQAVGWFQGRMEFGPRALGNRSILADARSPTMQRTLNQRVKHRESFRPFAPSVLRSDVSDWFSLDRDSPYMLFVAEVRPERRRREHEAARTLRGVERLHVPRSEIPAVTHVDHSARVQTVHRETNPRFHALLEAFKARTGCPVLVNTSFNVGSVWRCRTLSTPRSWRCCSSRW